MILDDIIAKRLNQLKREKRLISLPEMKLLASKAQKTRNFKSALKKKNLSIIAEVKKASPSKGVICENFDPMMIARAYEKAGADAISVLTEKNYFQGSSDYLSEIKKITSVPVLRKDFIIDEYQIYESKYIGADAILLIAALLDTKKISEFCKIADSLGLACLVEVHNEAELKSALLARCDIIGINNRNLKTFEVNLDITKTLAKNIENNVLLVSESGIKTNDDMRIVKSSGANAVLIGEAFMKKITSHKSIEEAIFSEMKLLRENI